MKKNIRQIAYAAGSAALLVPALAGAQSGYAPPGGTGLPESSVYGIVNNLMLWILALVGIVGVIGFAIAGIMYLTAAGDDDRVKTAKKAMLMSIVGVIVALVGLVALNWAEGLLGAEEAI